MTPALRREADRCSVVVVGLGAAGALFAHVLTGKGVDVIGLEAGPLLHNSAFPVDELTTYMFHNTLGRKFNNERPVWREKVAHRAETATASIGLMMNAVGGSSVHYAGWARRFFPDDFRALSSTLDRYGNEAVPKGSSLSDWPISYEELEPYYTRVEQFLGISGETRDPQSGTGNPFEGPRSAPYPLPPLRDFVGGKLFTSAARGLGLHPYKVPAAIVSSDYNGRQACTYCGWCSGYGCRFGSKSSTLVTAIPAALETGRLDLRVNASVVRILVEGPRAVGVEYIDEQGKSRVVRADRVVLAPYTFEAVRLLLGSRSPSFPTGLANMNGCVGRHFMTRNFLEVYGLFPDVELDRFAGPAGQAVCVDDFNADNFDHTGLGFVRGGTIGIENQLQPINAALTIPPGVRTWGREYKRFLLSNWNRIGLLRAQPETLPYEGNELDLIYSGESSRIRITHSFGDNERRMSQFLLARMGEILKGMGAERIWKGSDYSGILSGHDVGGLRMGSSPSDSVVDSYGRAHDVSGLVIGSGATFPTSTGVNPTLTIQALAWRSAEQTARDLARGDE